MVRVKKGVPRSGKAKAKDFSYALAPLYLDKAWLSRSSSCIRIRSTLSRDYVQCVYLGFMVEKAWGLRVSASNTDSSFEQSDDNQEEVTQDDFNRLFLPKEELFIVLIEKYKILCEKRNTISLKDLDFDSLLYSSLSKEWIIENFAQIRDLELYAQAFLNRFIQRDGLVVSNVTNYKTQIEEVYKILLFVQKQRFVLSSLVDFFYNSYFCLNPILSLEISRHFSTFLNSYSKKTSLYLLTKSVNSLPYELIKYESFALINHPNRVYFFSNPGLKNLVQIVVKQKLRETSFFMNENVIENQTNFLVLQTQTKSSYDPLLNYLKQNMDSLLL
mgnify:CR=1 FL=1